VASEKDFLAAVEKVIRGGAKFSATVSWLLPSLLRNVSPADLMDSLFAFFSVPVCRVQLVDVLK
jgi:hypothetical protein